MAGKGFHKVGARVPQDSKIFIAKSLDFAEALNTCLQRRGMSQKELAKKLGKSESEISKWLSGFHNITFKTIAKIEAALETTLVFVKGYHETKLTYTLKIQSSSAGHLGESKADEYSFHFQGIKGGNSYYQLYHEKLTTPARKTYILDAEHE